MLRFAPSPTGDMHIGNLRVALLNFIVAKQRNEQFIVRIEDTEREKNEVGKDEEILLILEKFALPHDQRFDQSENLHIHQTLAIRLLEENKAFICTCTPEQIEADRTEAKENNITYKYSGRCSQGLNLDRSKLKDENIPFVIRLHKPKASIVTDDIIQGTVTTTADAVDSFVILNADKSPTPNFACACDDMITGIDYIIRTQEHLDNTAKQIHIKNLLGYETKTKYAHLPTIEDDTSSIKWLFKEGFLPDAILNYLVELGNETPQEIFTLPDALEWFELENISKIPLKFDLERLRFINREHLRAMDDKKLSKLFGFADTDIGQLAKIYLQEASTINELQDKIKTIFAPKDFDGEWGKEMRIIADIIALAPSFSNFDDFKKFIVQESGLQEEDLLQALRYLFTGAGTGPELSDIYIYIKSYILEVAS